MTHLVIYNERIHAATITSSVTRQRVLHSDANGSSVSGTLKPDADDAARAFGGQVVILAVSTEQISVQLFGERRQWLPEVAGATAVIPSALENCCCRLR